MQLSKDELANLTDGYDTGPWTFVTREDLGEWRWGVKYRAIFRSDDGRHFGFDYQVATGDGDYHTLDDYNDDTPIDVFAVVPLTKTITAYERVPTSAEVFDVKPQ